jgi:uncharacterized protein YaiE (UPF0345 family)
VFWSRHPIGDLLFNTLDALVDAGVLMKRDEPDFQYRWNPDFKGTWEQQPTSNTESSMTKQLTATIQTKANVYFDGKCISHSIELPDGCKKSVGVILPSTLHFNTAAPEVMELIEGSCRIKLASSDAWQSYQGGQSFSVPGNSSFDIEVTTPALHYVCHFG